MGEQQMIKILFLLITLLFSGVAYGAESTTENMKGKMSTPEVVFAVCVFADGTLIDHKGAESMSDCLKTKREITKKWKLKSKQMDSIEINGITYQIDGEHLAFMCDLVDAHVHHYEDGSWEIVEILGKHKKEK
jgi:hypothetical protein